MTREPHTTGLFVEQLEDRLTPAGTTIPAGEFNWLQYSPTGELAELVWEGQTLVYRTRANDAWHEEAIATAGALTQGQYDTRDQVQAASSSAQLVFTGDGTPHVLFLDSVWVGSSNAYQTVIRDYARVGSQWQLAESISAPWLSTWGASNLVAEPGTGNTIHLLFSETYSAATGVGNQGTGILWYATNKSGSWTFDKVADTADPKVDVWFTGGRWAPRFLSLAVDSQDNAYVTYTPQFYIAGAFSTVYSQLMFATNRGGSWQSSVVYAPADGTGDAGLGASIAVGPNGQVAIASYFVDRYTTGSPQSSKLMYHTLNADGTWTHADVVTSPDGYVAGDGAKFTGFSPQLFFDASGRANIVFSDEAGQHNPVSYANQVSGQIRLATLTNGQWSVQTIYRQTDPLVNQLFYPVAATYNGQTTFAGLVATSHLDGDNNPTGMDFNIVEINAPSGPSSPVTAAPPDSSSGSGSTGGTPTTTPAAPGPNTAGTPMANAVPSKPAAMAVASPVQPGLTTTVSVYRSDGSLDFTITPFGSDYTSGVRVVRADVTGDGVPDIVVGSGGGIQARVRIWNGETRALIFDSAPFEDFAGAVNVAVGDVDGDGTPDILLAPDLGGGPRIQILNGKTFGKLVPDFYGLPYPEFRGGVQIASADVNGDGYADVIAAPGVGGGPRVTVYDGRSFTSPSGPHPLVSDFFAFDESVRTGVYLSAGDINGDGYSDIVIGSGVGGGPRVRVVSGAALASGKGPAVIADFYAASADERAGVRVGTTQGGQNRQSAILTGTAGSVVSEFDWANLASSPNPTPRQSFAAFPGLPGGVFVG